MICRRSASCVDRDVRFAFRSLNWPTWPWRWRALVCSPGNRRCYETPRCPTRRYTDPLLPPPSSVSLPSPLIPCFPPAAAATRSQTFHFVVDNLDPRLFSRELSSTPDFFLTALPVSCPTGSSHGQTGSVRGCHLLCSPGTTRASSGLGPNDWMFRPKTVFTSLSSVFLLVMPVSLPDVC